MSYIVVPVNLTPAFAQYLTVFEFDLTEWHTIFCVHEAYSCEPANSEHLFLHGIEAI